MNKIAAETAGTFILIFCGCGAIVVNAHYGGHLGHVGICMVFGLTVMAVIYSVGNISGAHINPAVTFGFFCAGRIRIREVPMYVASQLIGALAGAALLKALFPQADNLGMTLPAGSVMQSFVLEIVLTFILMFVVLNVSTGHKEKGIMAGAAVGGLIVLEALFGGPVSGASMNPARSLGPAFMSGNLEHIWIYLTAPMLGALLAHPTCKFIQGDQCCFNDKESTNGSEN